MRGRAWFSDVASITVFDSFQAHSWTPQMLESLHIFKCQQIVQRLEVDEEVKNGLHERGG